MQDFQYTRILSHGQITDLSQGYKADYPFSVYLRPKEGVEYQDDVLVRCRCMCDKELSDLPVAVGDWTTAAIVELAPDAIPLDEYDVYWGAGNPKF